MAGRKTKLTPDRTAKICQAIQLGATYDHACNYAGISMATFCEWRKSKPEFSEAIQKAEGNATVGWLAKIEKAANDGQWQAAAWKLERRYPHEYGRRVQEITGKDGGPVEVKDVRSEIARRLAALDGEAEG
jgi:hypothetical protein